MLIVHIYSWSHSVHHSLMNHGKSTLPLLSPHNTHMRHGFNSGAATWHIHPNTPIQIPQSAQRICRPLTCTTQQQALSQYPNQQLAQFFLQGIS